MVIIDKCGVEFYFECDRYKQKFKQKYHDSFIQFSRPNLRNHDYVHVFESFHFE